MSSFLKRITPVGQIGMGSTRTNAHLYFELDEPYFALKQRFSTALSSNNARARHFNHNVMVSCPRCGNTEFSHQASFCKICGYQVFNKS
jgi:ribosomal protein S27AE